MPSGVQGGGDHAQRLGMVGAWLGEAREVNWFKKLTFWSSQDMISLTYTCIQAQYAQCLWIVQTTLFFDI